MGSDSGKSGNSGDPRNNPLDPKNPKSGQWDPDRNRTLGYNDFLNGGSYNGMYGPGPDEKPGDPIDYEARRENWNKEQDRKNSDAGRDVHTARDTSEFSDYALQARAVARGGLDQYGYAHDSSVTAEPIVNLSDKARQANAVDHILGSQKSGVLGGDPLSKSGGGKALALERDGVVNTGQSSSGEEPEGVFNTHAPLPQTSDFLGQHDLGIRKGADGLWTTLPAEDAQRATHRSSLGAVLEALPSNTTGSLVDPEGLAGLLGNDNPFAPKSFEDKYGKGTRTAFAPALAAAPFAWSALVEALAGTALGAALGYGASRMLEDPAEKGYPADPPPTEPLPGYASAPKEAKLIINVAPPPDLLGGTPPTVPTMPQVPDHLENVPGMIDVPSVVDMAGPLKGGPFNHDKGEPLAESTEKGLQAGRNQSDVDVVRGIVSSSGSSIDGERDHTDQTVQGGQMALDRDFETLTQGLGVNDKGIQSGPTTNGGTFKSFTSKSGDVHVNTYTKSTSTDGPTMKITVDGFSGNKHIIGRRYE